MAVEKGEGGTIITGEHISMFAHMSMASRLGLEITTGMKWSGGSSMLAAGRICGSRKRTKRGVLADYVAWMSATYPGYKPAPSIVKALGK